MSPVSLQELSDRLEINDLLIRYTRAIDTRDFELLDSCFLPDAAVDYIDQALQQPEKPFLLHVCYNAPHFPLEAPDELIEKYRGRYLAGWDELRKEKLARMKQMGLLPVQQNGGVEAMAALVADGAVSVTIDRTFALEETAAALRYLGEGHARGKVVIVPAREGSAS